MNGSINGWGVISRYLRFRKRNKSDLARLLHISPASITLIKKGEFKLNPKQCFAIAKYLRFDPDTLDDFFTEIVNARMRIWRGEELRHGNYKFTVKVVEK